MPLPHRPLVLPKRKTKPIRRLKPEKRPDKNNPLRPGPGVKPEPKA